MNIIWSNIPDIFWDKNDQFYCKISSILFLGDPGKTVDEDGEFGGNHFEKPKLVRIPGNEVFEDLIGKLKNKPVQQRTGTKS